MVNDAKSGPRQEALVSDTNEIYYPRGNDVTMMIPKGWGVLNGTQTQQISKSAGIRHFAKGSGVSDSQLQKIAENGLKSPEASFKNMFTNNVKVESPDIQKGMTTLGKVSSTKLGNPWMLAMWQVISDAIGAGGGSRKKFLEYAEKTFSGVRYVMGAASKTASDCSGMVMQALAHFGINIGRTTVAMQESSGVQYLGKDLSNTKPGDLVIFGHGTGAAGHVGIIKNPRTGTMFNETPPEARVTDIASDKSMGYGYYRVKRLHDQDTQHKPADKRLMALAKRELGSKAIKWIGDNLGESGDFVAGKATGDHNHWLKQAKIPEKYWTAMNYIFSHEAGWNPNAVNPSSGTYGLGQMQGYNLHYYTKYGSKSNTLAQIRGSYDYMNDRYGSPNGALSWWQSHHWYSKGGNAPARTPFIAGENGPELITANGPVHIDSHEQTKRKLSDIKNLMSPKTMKDITSKFTINKPRNSVTNTKPVININITGPISSKSDATKYGDIIADKIASIFERIGDDYGLDLSIY